MNTEKLFNISDVLANLANLMTILDGVKDIGRTLIGMGSSLLALVQICSCDSWVEAGIVLAHIVLIVVLYFNYRIIKELQGQVDDLSSEKVEHEQAVKKLQEQVDALSSEEVEHERTVKKLQEQVDALNSEKVLYQQTIPEPKELQVQLPINSEDKDCEFSEEELETYKKCERSDKPKVSYRHLRQLKDKFLKCSERRREQANETVTCLAGQLSQRDKKSLVHVYSTRDDDELSEKIYKLLGDNSLFSTHLMVEGLNRESHEHNLLISCKWIVVLYDKSENEETLKKRLDNCQKYRKAHSKARILVCYSKLMYPKIGKYLKDQSDLIHPDNCSIELVKKIKGITDE